jgi:hypothetical protein
MVMSKSYQLRHKPKNDLSNYVIKLLTFMWIREGRHQATTLAGAVPGIYYVELGKFRLRKKKE